MTRSFADNLATFLRFAFLSGIGWLCDFGTYALLVEMADFKAATANFISSYVGVTFVYFTALRFAFSKVTHNHRLFLSLYWVYQFASIVIYSALLAGLVHWLLEQPSLAPNTSDIGSYPLNEYTDIIGKLIITPVNLITNFIFMKALTHYMQDEVAPHV